MNTNNDNCVENWTAKVKRIFVSWVSVKKQSRILSKQTVSFQEQWASTATSSIKSRHFRCKLFK